MPRDWGNTITVASVLANTATQSGTPKTYYPTDNTQTKEQLQSSYIATEQITINGRSYTLNQITQWDVKVFADELDARLRRMNPFIWEIFANNALNCLVAMRLANNEDSQGFGGAVGSGNAIDDAIFAARTFYDPDNQPNNRRNSWERTIAATGPKDFIVGATSGSSLSLTKYESMIFLAWYNPTDAPLVDMYQITYNTIAYDWQEVDFEENNIQQGDVVCEWKEPWILPPNESGYVAVDYYKTGLDTMRPIGLYFKESKNMRQMASSPAGTQPTSGVAMGQN